MKIRLKFCLDGEEYQGCFRDVQKIPGSGGSPDAVLYTEQELTEEQQMQARKNQALYYSAVENVTLFESVYYYGLENDISEKDFQSNNAIIVKIENLRTGEINSYECARGIATVANVGESYWFGNADLASFHHDEANYYPDYPFLIYRDGVTNEPSEWIFVANENVTGNRFRITVYDAENTETVHHPIPDEYMPDTVARTAAVKAMIADAQVQSDWGQNDETAKDYVKGRTHYEETVPGQILHEYTQSQGGSEVFQTSVNTDNIYDLVFYIVDDYGGKSVLVNYGLLNEDSNEVHLTGSFIETTVYGATYYCLGGFHPATAGYLPCVYTSDLSTIHVTISGADSAYPVRFINADGHTTITHPLDPKYIPDSVHPTFIVTITENGVDEDGNTVYSADKTLSEIFAAIEAGKNVIALFNGYQYPINGYQQPHWIEFSCSDYVGYGGYLMNSRIFINDEGVLYEYYDTDLPNVMEGATADEDGLSGLVPAPAAGDNNKFLRGDGTWAEAGGSDSGDAIPAPSTAEVGQTIVVTEVDESGKPTAWEAADLGSYEDKPFRLINTVSVTADDGVSGVDITTDSDGNSFELDEAYVIVKSRTRYSGWAYSQISTNAGTIGEERQGTVPFIIVIKKYLGMWKASYTAAGYTAAGYGAIWGLNHSVYMHNVADYPKITKIGFGFTACELEVWGR